MFNKDKNLIFLDFDHVLNVNFGEKDKYGHLFNKIPVKALKRLIEALDDPLIIVSSAWRSHGLNYLKDMWEYRNLPGEIFDITTHLMFDSRGEEIDDWRLKNNAEENPYLIVDDVLDFQDHHKEHLLHCYGNYLHAGNFLGWGLTETLVDKGIKIMSFKKR